MLDMSAVDDCLATGLSAPMGSTKPSLAKSLKKTRSCEAEGFVTMSLPSYGYAYSDPSFVKDIADSLLLLADRKRFMNIGPIQMAKWSLVHIYQVG